MAVAALAFAKDADTMDAVEEVIEIVNPEPQDEAGHASFFRDQ